MRGQISASLMCVNFLDALTDLKALEAAGVEYLHFDIMDGEFVPNYALGPDFMRVLRGAVDIPYDVHMMVSRPEDKIDYMGFRQGDWVSVHAEATVHLQRLLSRLKDMGVHPGVAINPATPVSAIENVLDDIDFVLIMTVNPGFAGQKLVPHTLKKITQVRQMLVANGMGDKLIQVDGNVNYENALKMRAAGADVFILGSSGLFVKDTSIEDAAKKMREALK